MTTLLTELKTRARLSLNAARREQPELRLRDCLHQAARDVGFAHWDHGRRILGGQAVPGDDMGTFWRAPRWTPSTAPSCCRTAGSSWS